MRYLIACLLLLLMNTAVPSMVLASTQETVYLETASNGSAVIVRSNGDRYLIEYGPGFPTLPIYVGQPVRVQYFNYFLDMESLIMTPDSTETGRVARIWRAELLNFIPSASASEKVSTFRVGDTRYSINGVEHSMDVAPYLKNDRVLLPLLYVAEALGIADDKIAWDDKTRRVTITGEKRLITLTIGSQALVVNGVDLNMDVPAEISSGRTMLPLRWVATALGAQVAWDAAAQTVTVSSL